MFFDQTIVRVRAGRKPDRGNPANTLPDWSSGAVTRLTVTAVSVQPKVQSESTDPERNEVITGWRVQSEPGANPDITAVDRIEWDGLTLQVQGEIARWTDPIDGGVHHVEFDMERGTG